MSNQNNDLYRYLFATRKAYKRKCPDLCNNIFYEYESFKKFTDNTLSKMISEGLSQSDIIIIDLKGTGLSNRDVLEKLYAYMNQKKSKKITELWGLRKQGIELVYH